MQFIKAFQKSISKHQKIETSCGGGVVFWSKIGGDNNGFVCPEPLGGG